MQLATTTIPVHCVNCGGGDSSTSLVVALIGVIIAAIALAVSIWALQTATKEHALSVTEHTEFLKQLKARARFRLTARLRIPSDNADPDVLDARGATATYARLEIGLTNVGDKLAGPTTMDVLAPARARALRWTDASGTPFGTEPASTSERLGEGDGEAAQWISHGIPRVGRTSLLHWVQFLIDDPSVASVTVRIKAQSDDLPEDIPEEILDYTFSVLWS